MSEKKSFDNLTVVDHPVIQDRLSVMRAKQTANSDFKQALKEISLLMASQVTQHLATKKIDVETPLENTTQEALQNGDPVLVSILRAGLGMSEPMADIFSQSPIGYIGVRRDEETKEPEEYLVKLPLNIKEKDIIVIDPMLATGHSLCHAVDVLLERGVAKESIVCMTLVSAPEGVGYMKEKHSDIKVFTASLDEKLNQDAFIVPGLGDAGDRLFGT